MWWWRGAAALERPNGLFREVREHRRKTLAALLKQLGLVESDVDGAPVVPLHISAARRAAVKFRWDRVHAERASGEPPSARRWSRHRVR